MGQQEKIYATFHQERSHDEAPCVLYQKKPHICKNFVAQGMPHCEHRII